MMTTISASLSRPRIIDAPISMGSIERASPSGAPGRDCWRTSITAEIDCIRLLVASFCRMGRKLIAFDAHDSGSASRSGDRYPGDLAQRHRGGTARPYWHPRTRQFAVHVVLDRSGR